MTKVTKITACLLSGTALIGFSYGLASSAHAASVSVQSVYRLYNKNTGEHFYTTSATEKNAIARAGWTYEGVGWRAPSYSSSPVYRVYNPNVKGGDHYYTSGKYEASQLVAKGWHWDNNGKPVFYSATADKNDVFVAYNPNAQSGAHNYTTSWNEEDNLLNNGWEYPKTAWYGTTGNYNWNAQTRVYTNSESTLRLGSITKTTDFEGKAALRINFTITNRKASNEDTMMLLLDALDVQQVTQNTSDSLNWTPLNFNNDNH